MVRRRRHKFIHAMLSQHLPCDCFLVDIFISVDENLVFVRLLLGLSAAVVVVRQFSSFPLFVVC